GDEFVAADGLGSGPQRQLDVGELGAFIFHGGHFDFELSGAIQALSPLLRRMRADEALAVKAGELVRRNAALEQYAAFVAHELKPPLHEALVAEDDSKLLHEALDLVDALLHSAHDAHLLGVSESLADCLETVVRDLGGRADGLEVTSDLAPSLP